MKKMLSILIIFFASVAMYAQNETDALRYSLVNYGGTARFSGMSGAYGAVGADFSSLSQNPAGIGLYRKSEFSITPMLANNKTESNFLGNLNTDYRTTLYLANVGYVMSVKLNDNNGSHLKMIQFGFGMNNTATYNNRLIVNGLNSENSLMTQYLDDANFAGSRDNLDNFGAGLAYDVNLLYQDTNNVWQVDLPYGGLKQTKAVESWGSTNEIVMSAGTNFSDKLFLGLTFGFPQVNYKEESTYFEKDDKIPELSPYLKSLTRTEYLYTKGSGFNFKFGFIYKPADFVRIGGAFHTPTSFYNMNDTYGASMTANYDLPPLSSSTATRFDATSPDGSYDYRITTPMRAIGSLAFVIGQYGVISADYEYVDYSTAQLHASDYSFIDENNTIRSAYTAANNFRFGTEWKAGIYAFRGGYSINGSPYKGGSTFGASTGYSFGFGIHDKDYFVDFAYNHRSLEDNFYLYSYAPASKNTYKINNYSFTLGFKL